MHVSTPCSDFESNTGVAGLPKLCANVFVPAPGMVASGLGDRRRRVSIDRPRTVNMARQHVTCRPSGCDNLLKDGDESLFVNFVDETDEIDASARQALVANWFGDY